MTTSDVNSGVSRDEFLSNLRDSGIFPGDEYAAHVREVARFPNAPAVMQHLVAARLLTEFQVAAVAGRQFDRLRLGNYDVLAKLGAGGMGAVYKARHRRMKRIVAVKVLAAEIAGQGSFVKRFQREVETIAQLSHPNIVMAYDADESESGFFLVMEFVDGRDLASEVEKAGPLSVAAAVDCIAQAAQGLAYAHSKGIIHRDIKPANLMLTVDGLVKVADLGLARFAKAPGEGDSSNFSITQAGGILGTVDYMPPEQAMDSTAIDHRADVYSLGCTLHYLLTGKPPYSAGSLMGLMLQHREANIPNLQTVRSDVPYALATAFERMVAKRPANRTGSMAEVIQAMEALKAQVKDLTTRPGSKPITPGSGAKNADMTVDITAGSSLVAPAPLAPPSESRLHSDIVLVLVEPSRTQSTIVRGYFANLGIGKVHATKSGAEAVALAKQQSAHAIVSSMHLSDMTGYQLAASLRADPACGHVGFVLMSSESDAGHANAAEGSRTVLLMKPFDLKQLAQAIATATGRKPETIMPVS